jgi:glucose-1-phosphatase
LNSVKALLFDLGGVVIDIDFNLVFLRWAKYANRRVEEIMSRFSFDQFYKAHERGEIESNEYFESLRKSLGIDISDLQFEDGWNSIYKGEIPGIAKLFRKAKGNLPLHAFTNSNHLHQRVWSKKFSDILSNFQIVFNSSDIGKRKPEAEAFQMIADTIGIHLSEMIFYDDSIENIIGAKKVGLNTVHVRSIKDVEESFVALFL